MLEIRREGDVDVIAMAHGKVNALDLELLEALSEAFRSRAADGTAILLTGKGRMFSAGVDLRRIVEGGADYVHQFLPALSEAFLAIFEHPGPVVAAVNGHALAGGTIIAAACDVRLAAEGSAQLGVTELRVGVPFPTSAMEILRHGIGDVSAAALVYTAARVDVAEAHRLGLITEIIPAGGDLLQAAGARASELAAIGGAAYRLAKQQLRRDAHDRIRRHRDHDDSRVAALWSAPEGLAAIKRYLESL